MSDGIRANCEAWRTDDGKSVVGPKQKSKPQKKAVFVALAKHLIDHGAIANSTPSDGRIVNAREAGET